MESKEANAIKDFTLSLIDIARKEGEKFRKENGRDPTEAEAQRIADMIERQAKTALIISKMEGD